LAALNCNVIQLLILVNSAGRGFALISECTKLFTLHRTMSGYDDLNSARKKLEAALGENAKT
jgi:hypothetical protein